MVISGKIRSVPLNILNSVGHSKDYIVFLAGIYVIEKH